MNAGLAAAIPLFGSVPTLVREIPASQNPESRTQATVIEMIRSLKASVSSEPVGRAVREALRGVNQDDEMEVAHGVFRWIQRKIRFVEDEDLVYRAIGLEGADEALVSPDRLLTMPQPQGDCDDFSQLTCAMLLRAGVKCHLATVAADPEDPSRWSHVYAVMEKKDGSQVPFDASHGTEVGWEAPRYFKRRVWPIMSLDAQVLEGRPDRRVVRINDPGSREIIHGEKGFRGLRGLRGLSGLGNGYDYGGTYYGDVADIPLSENMGDVYTATPGGAAAGGGSTWADVASQIAGTFGKAVASRIQFPAGTVYQSGPGGTTLIRTTPEAAAYGVAGSALGSSGNILIYLGLGIAVLFAVSAMGRS